MKRVKRRDHDKAIIMSRPKRPKFPRRDVPVDPLCKPKKAVFHLLRFNSHPYRHQADSTGRSRCVQNARVDFMPTAFRCSRMLPQKLFVKISELFLRPVRNIEDRRRE